MVWKQKRETQKPEKRLIAVEQKESKSHTAEKGKKCEKKTFTTVGGKKAEKKTGDLQERKKFRKGENASHAASSKR